MTGKVTLRPLEKEDIDFMHCLTNNPDVMSFWFEEAYNSKAKLEEMYMKNKENSHERLFILERNQERLGFVALYFIDPIHRKAEFAIMIDPMHQGLGYAGEGTRLAIDYAFTVLNLNKLYLIVDEVNDKAKHIYKKKGFKEEAVLKEEYFVNGSYHDAVMMSMFQKEYFSKQD